MLRFSTTQTNFTRLFQALDEKVNFQDNEESQHKRVLKYWLNIEEAFPTQFKETILEIFMMALFFRRKTWKVKKHYNTNTKVNRFCTFVFDWHKYIHKSHCKQQKQNLVVVW